MKVLFLGASGVIGQFCRLAQPPSVTAVYYRREADCLHKGCDLEHWPAVLAMLREEQPDVIVNLAGESRPDVVEKDPERYEFINRHLPMILGIYTFDHRERFRLIHVSTQARYGGNRPPYGCVSVEAALPDLDGDWPANRYAQQKWSGEYAGPGIVILRPTFILGARPLPHVGRQNPLEDWQRIRAAATLQVNDRWFSPCFAEDAAAAIWSEVLEPKAQGVANVGIPVRTCRYELAKHIATGPVDPVSHDFFQGIAPRPLDTTYADEGPYMFHRSVQEGMAAHVQRIRDFEERNVADRAREIALFLGLNEDVAQVILSQGFSAMNNMVSDDWRNADPQNNDDILTWYRTTERYIWELSAYHCDPGFNTKQQHFGISEALKAHGCKRVLCLGDGIGELTLRLHEAGFDAVYHDLDGSRTAAFAAFRFWRRIGQEMPHILTKTFEPRFYGSGSIHNLPWLLPSGLTHMFVPSPFDAIISLDFLEHVTNVEDWTRASHSFLKPGGYFVAQNAFAMGSGPNGSMPMHLACNDRYERDWDPELAAIGFEQIASNWYRRAA